MLFYFLGKEWGESNMTFEAYTNPDFTIQQKLLFFVVALAGILVCNILIIAGVKISTLHKEKKNSRSYCMKEFITAYSAFMR